MASRGRGRILAIKWGMNPNSSSLGVDVTFLLVGAAAVAMATPLVGAWLRWRRPAADAGSPGSPATIDASETIDPIALSPGSRRSPRSIDEGADEPPTPAAR